MDIEAGKKDERIKELMHKIEELELSKDMQFKDMKKVIDFHEKSQEKAI